MAGVNSIQTVGDFVATMSHPSVLNGTQLTLKGFKLEDTFVSSAQAVENSKLIPLVDGGTVQLTNSVSAGRLTINALRVTNTLDTSGVSGDIVLIASTLQTAGVADSQGGTINFSFGFNGKKESITFYDVTLVSGPPILLAGNDLPVYAIVWNYSHYERDAK